MLLKYFVHTMSVLSLPKDSHKHKILWEKLQVGNLTIIRPLVVALIYDKRFGDGDFNKRFASCENIQ